jgi:DNA-binding transcriptional LysR family regulator
MGLYASRDVALAVDPSGEGISSATRGVPLLVYTAELAVLQHARWFQPVMEHGEVRLRATSSEVIARAALAGYGVGVLPHVVARTSRSKLVKVAARDVLRSDVWLITHPEFRKSPEIAAVHRFLKQIGPELC